MLNQITPLLITHNEAPNIGRTLEQLRWADDIVVVDSFSDDNTLNILASFPLVRVFQRKFDSFAGQCNFGLTETDIDTEWVMSLDADYVLTADLLEELRVLDPDGTADGFSSSFTYCINGKPLRSGLYPPLTFLFRRKKAHFVVDGHAHRVFVQGEVQRLNSSILHDDRKPLARWYNSQLLYSKLEAEKLIQSDPKALSWTDRIRCWRVFAPFAIAFYCLVLRGGLFDGWSGFYYAFQRTLAELMLSLYLIDHDLQAANQVEDNKQHLTGC